MAKSRVRRRQETIAKKHIILMGLAILAILILGIWFGPQLLVRFSVAIENIHSTSSSGSTSDASSDTYVAPPNLDPLPQATNSAGTKVTGYALAGQTIKLYLNGSLADQTTTQDDGTFSFDSVSLDKGTNTIKAQAVTKDNKTSSFSDLMTISYLSQNPTLTVDQPQDGQHFSHDTNTVPVTGKADPQDSVTVNGFWAIVSDSGNYSYQLPINDGDTTITVVATDQAGNSTTKTLKVNRGS